MIVDCGGKTDVISRVRFFMLKRSSADYADYTDSKAALKLCELIRAV
jgi:hypothetical protein